jgi:hypothetical protein
MSPDAATVLRARLLSLRIDAVEQLAASDRLDAGILALVGDIGAALMAIDEKGVAITDARGTGRNL